MEKDKITLSIILSRETWTKLNEDTLCKNVFLGKKSPMIEQILRKHYKLKSLFDMIKDDTNDNIDCKEV